MSCKMLQGGHRLEHNTRGTHDGFLEINDMKKEEGRKQMIRRLYQWRRTRCWMIQIEERDVESVLTSMTSSFCLHLQFPGYPMTVSDTFCRHENPLLKYIETSLRLARASHGVWGFALSVVLLYHFIQLVSHASCGPSDLLKVTLVMQ